jgi:hypothetical protein
MLDELTITNHSRLESTMYADKFSRFDGVKPSAAALRRAVLFWPFSQGLPPQPADRHEDHPSE